MESKHAINTMPKYKITGKVPNTDKIKTITCEVYSEMEAMDYAAMFHNIDEIISITQIN